MAGRPQYDIDITLFKSISYLRIAVLSVVKKLELDIQGKKITPGAIQQNREASP
jgi:hypothetical protein